MQSRATAQRVRKAMFPDFSFDESLIHEEYNQHSVLNSFMEPSCSVQKAVVDLLNVPDQSKELDQQIGSLIPLLASNDPVGVLSNLDSLSFVFRPDPQLLHEKSIYCPNQTPSQLSWPAMSD